MGRLDLSSIWEYLVAVLYVTGFPTQIMPTAEAEETPAGQKTDSDRLDPWIEDGNIVLAVQGKYFRVHRSILSSYSAVFKDMFDSSQSSEGDRSEFIEQCPVIQLHDAVTDVQMVLKAMYDRR